MNAPSSFEWDDNKAASNLAKHGIRFEVAARAFIDPKRLEIPDTRFDYGEERTILLGSVQGLVLLVVYTMRPLNVARIISARAALPHEEAAYHGDVQARQGQFARFQRRGAFPPYRPKR